MQIRQSSASLLSACSVLALASIFLALLAAAVSADELPAKYLNSVWCPPRR